MRILTHRGLEPGNPDFHFAESSYEAFESQLRRGYGIEFDVNFSKDGTCFAFHDSSMRRISGGKDVRDFSGMEYEEIKSISLPGGCRFATLTEILRLISEHSQYGKSALHLKAKHAASEKLEVLADALNQCPNSKNNILAFDVKTDVARFFKIRIPGVQVFASVAHAYDVARYSSATGGTLLTLSEFEANSSLYDGAWLDEWDLAGEGETVKQLYIKEVFFKIRNMGKEIASVSPELHGTSPGLIGSESHPDATFPRLAKRIAELIKLNPDYICTDYPETWNKSEK